ASDPAGIRPPRPESHAIELTINPNESAPAIVSFITTLPRSGCAYHRPRLRARSLEGGEAHTAVDVAPSVTLARCSRPVCQTRGRMGGRTQRAAMRSRVAEPVVLERLLDGERVDVARVELPPEVVHDARA